MGVKLKFKNLALFACWGLAVDLVLPEVQSLASEGSNHIKIRSLNRHPFPTHSLWVGMSQTFPNSRSALSFDSGTVTPAFGVRYFDGGHQVAGFSASMKHLGGKGKVDQLALLSLTQGLHHLTLVNFPWFMTVGGLIKFMIPYQGAELPPSRNKDFEMEVGAGVHSSLIYLWPGSFWTSAEASLWRGTKTRKLSGFDVNLRFGWAL